MFVKAEVKHISKLFILLGLTCCSNPEVGIGTKAIYILKVENDNQKHIAGNAIF